MKPSPPAGPRHAYVPALAGALVLLGLYAASVAFRIPDFDERGGSRNREAPYHVLLVVKALGESPAGSHWMLPTVSLGNGRDKWIPWGAAVPTPTGDFIYLSFPPAGFLAPYLFFEVTGVPATFGTLALFNAGIGLLSALLLYVLVRHVLRRYGLGPWSAAAVAVAASTISVFSCEALQATGVSYWSHSLYQPILVLSVYAFFLVYAGPSASPWSRRGLVALAFVGPLIEWTGYVFNVGAALLLRGDENATEGRLPLKIVGSTMAAGLVTLLHFSLGVGVGPAIDALKTRFLARSSGTGSLAGLVEGYAWSYGLFLVVVGLALGWGFLRMTRNSGPSPAVRDPRAAAAVLLVAAFPLLENALMLQHASQFTFDRFKFAIPAALAIALAAARMSRSGKALLAVGLALSSFHGMASYRRDIRAHASWIAVHDGNQQAAAVAKSFASPCTLIATNGLVRGYANLALSRGIWEVQSLDAAMSLMDRLGACQLLFIDATSDRVDLPRFDRITLVNPDRVRRIVYDRPP